MSEIQKSVYVCVCSHVLIKFGYMFRDLKCYQVYLKCGSRQCPQPLSQSIRMFCFTLLIFYTALCVSLQNSAKGDQKSAIPRRLQTDPSDPMTKLHDSHRNLKLFLYELRIKFMVIPHSTTELHPECPINQSIRLAPSTNKTLAFY